MWNNWGKSECFIGNYVRYLRELFQILRIFAQEKEEEILKRPSLLSNSKKFSKRMNCRKI